jgi:hypothetical protein
MRLFARHAIEEGRDRGRAAGSTVRQPVLMKIDVVQFVVVDFLALWVGRLYGRR